ncbi:hypothetical protein HRbin30_03118 [bacterium HR30]|nr:hypothetical protein HRbin30_03118 [bacterium HR30]
MPSVFLEQGHSEPRLRESQGKRPEPSSRRSEREFRRRLKEIEELEETIATKEEELEALRRLISKEDFYATTPNPHAYYSQFAHLQREIEHLYARLERLEDAQQRAVASSKAG